MATWSIELLISQRGHDAYSIKSFRPKSRADQKAVHRIRKTTGIDFVFHDLRRTAASHMTAMGISRLGVSKLLNHVERGITAVYDRHSYDADKRGAVARWERKSIDILERKPKREPEKVVAIPRRQNSSVG